MLTHNHKHSYRPLLLAYLISMVPVSGCSMYLSNNIKVVVTYSDNFRNMHLIQSSSIFIELLVSGIASVAYKINDRQ